MTERIDEPMSDILWRRLNYFLTPQLDLYKNIAPHLSGKQTLEVGFGTGFGTIQLAQYARGILAIEPDSQAAAFAWKVLPITGVVWQHADITEVTPHPLYDAVVMVETLEHIKEWRKALENIRDFLKPGGKLYMTARNRNADLRRNDLHEREWSAQELTYNLRLFFDDVKLYDYRLCDEVDIDTHITPLIAVATKKDSRRKAGGNGTDSGGDARASG